jgi:5-carboxymethyl-2-hydroxymuconate isomerase
MPHLVMEYSQSLQDNINIPDLLTQLHGVVLQSELFAPQAVKARAMPYSDSVLHADYNSFMHLSCSILAGRSEEQRLALSNALFDCAKPQLPQDCALSINIHEMNTATYRK